MTQTIFVPRVIAGLTRISNFVPRVIAGPDPQSQSARVIAGLTRNLNQPASLAVETTGGAGAKRKSGSV
jgi:hypothetical protein